MKRSCAGRAPMTCELALGIEATLEATEKDIGHVRTILRGAVECLVLEFGERAFREGVVALQFQDLSDQLLANAQRRIDLVRAALGEDVEQAEPPREADAPLSAGGLEYFHEAP
ncbi:MAG: hypothetical protein ACXWGU_16055 [Usitatibacter sp.]